MANYNIPEKAGTAVAVASKLREFGECEINVLTYNKEKLAKFKYDTEQFTYLPGDQLYVQSDIIIVLGGDGTILDAARRAAPSGKPILGFNLGRLGYMAELDVNELDKLEALFNGDYHIEERAMLSVEVISVNKKCQNLPIIGLFMLTIL